MRTCVVLVLIALWHVAGESNGGIRGRAVPEVEVHRSSRCWGRTGKMVFSCGKTVFSCGKMVFSCGKMVFSCGRMVFSCGRMVFSCGRMVFSCGSMFFSCGRMVFSCGKMVMPCDRTTVLVWSVLLMHKYSILCHV